MINAKFITACLAVLAFAGVQADKPEKLVQGRAASLVDFPYMASLRANGNHFCGGAIVSTTLILTAAHCVYGLENQPRRHYTVVTGSDNIRYGGQTHEISVFLHHSYYNPGVEGTSWDYDLGAVKLRAPIEFNQFQRAIPVTSQPPVFGTPAVVSAWGAVGKGAPLSQFLQQLTVTMVSPQECQHYLAHRMFESHICTWRGPGVGTCSGDSGSPLVSRGVLVGVVSGGIPCAVGVPDVFTNVYALRGFIPMAEQYTAHFTRFSYGAFRAKPKSLPLHHEDPVFRKLDDSE